jgi:hypothetical protein
MEKPTTLKDFQSAFDDVMKSHGGRFDVEAAEEPPRGLLTWVLEQQRTLLDLLKSDTANLPSMPDVYIDYVNHSKVGARSCVRDGIGFIGLYVGGIRLIYALFLRMLAYRDVLPGVGDASLNSEEAIPLPYLYTDFTLYESFEARQDKTILSYPLDRTRRNVASYLASLAIRFLVVHEYAHIKYGHLALKEKYGLEQSMTETDQTGLPPLVSQALEMDADAWATCIGVHHGLAELQKNPIDPSYWTTPQSVLDFAYLWTISIYTIFRIYSIARPEEEELTEKAYPPPIYRLSWNMTNIAEWFVKRGWKELIDPYHERITSTIGEAEFALARIIGDDMDVSHIVDAFSSVSSEHLSAILDCWRDEVRPQLEGLCYATNLIS